AQGFIVVASNYAGYDTSALPYHPYLNADQQASDMVDSLRAARKAFPAIGAQDSGKLVISGYSQGGYVAMATQRAMQTTYASEFKVSG
ncbi:lipase family protein, partial [Acinetobacter baumannii]